MVVAYNNGISASIFEETLSRKRLIEFTQIPHQRKYMNSIWHTIIRSQGISAGEVLHFFIGKCKQKNKTGKKRFNFKYIRVIFGIYYLNEILYLIVIITVAKIQRIIDLLL